MSFNVVYIDTGSIVASYGERAAAEAAAMELGRERPDLAVDVGVLEFLGTGEPAGDFTSAAELLDQASPSPDAAAEHAAQVADEASRDPEELATTARLTIGAT